MLLVVDDTTDQYAFELPLWTLVQSGAEAAFLLGLGLLLATRFLDGTRVIQFAVFDDPRTVELLAWLQAAGLVLLAAAAALVLRSRRPRPTEV